MFTSFFHLTYIYLYDDAKTVPVKGGTISEGLIGNFPSLNPIKNLSGNNQYIISLLYRSLLKYDLKENKIIGDIANCDISSLLNIECYINEDAKWSNGEKITALDIFSTYELIKSTNSNIILSSLLEETKIEYKDNIIIFKNNKKDINFLNVFFQPILSEETINSLSKENIFGNFPTTGGIYSGEFIIGSVSSDLTIGVSKIVLDKNPHYNNGNISRVILNIFPDVNTFLKNKQSVNIFNDDTNIVGTSIPRLASYKYTLPQYVGLFINQNKITDINFRNFIFNKINSNNLVDLLGKDNFSIVNNPYITETNIEKETQVKNFESIMKSLGYKKKSKFIEDLIPKEQTNTEIKENNEEINVGTEEKTIDDFQKDSITIVKPSYVEKYNFITKEDILLEGNSNKDVQEIFINEYKLENYKSGDEKFYYRLKESLNNLKEGKNNYKIYFVVNGEKILKEEINFLYYKDKEKLKTEETKFIEELINEEKKQEEKKIIEANNNTDKKENPLALVNQEELNKVNKLDENIYYDKDLNPFTLRLYYLNTERNLEQTAYFIKNSLKELGIETEIIPFDLNTVSKILSSKDDYDMILTGVNLGFFDYNIFPYFHSSQSKNGYNFSNIKKTSLDLLLEELKSNILSEEKTKEIQDKILEILKDEQVIKTLYTPKINLLVDKNLKNDLKYEKLPIKQLRSYVLSSSYIKEEKIINFENKSIFGFTKFIFKKLYG
ncbi:MAG: ABC transporter substrate-binding protein [Candidatus Gracilibacteria bacterium]|nr:ABC transporter substrate-binding protein [Candidatus Gracilibacteria bacterium]